MEKPIKQIFISRETHTYENIDRAEKADSWERNLITTKLRLRQIMRKKPAYTARMKDFIVLLNIVKTRRLL